MTIQSVYGGRDRVPGISAAVETFENEFVWGRWENREISGLQIDGATRDTGNTGSTHILRAGLMLGYDTATKELKIWDADAADSTKYCWGILKESRSMLSQNTSTDRLSGAIIISGGIRADKIIIPGETTLGIDGKTDEMQARLALRKNFMLHDDFFYGRPEWFIHDVTAAEQTGGKTLTVDDTHVRFHNTGGTVTITLPTTAYLGLEYIFYAQTSTTDAITVSSGSSNILVPGSASASSLAVDGAVKKVTGDGTNWIVEAL